jgi:hypothetical protein
VQNQVVLLGVLGPSIVLCVFIRLFLIADRVQVCEREGMLAAVRYICQRLEFWLWWWAVMHMFKFRFSYELLGPAVFKSPGGLTRRSHRGVRTACSHSSGTRLAQVVLARIDIRVGKSVALQLLESVTGLSARIDCHSFN